jgi:hypothetical protein
MILFLNKTDLFEEKIPHSKFSTYFPEYEGMQVTARLSLVRDLPRRSPSCCFRTDRSSM